jgi:ribulose-phosphate 3-epimerase
MAVVAPSVTAPDAAAYRAEMANAAQFAKRVHVDFSDGEFAPIKLINLAQAYWPDEMLADLHLMYKHPTDYFETAVSLKPHMVIVQAEASGNLIAMMLQLRALGIKAGVALLQATQPHEAADLIAQADHVLIFSGDLGHFGGTANMELLKKVSGIRAINPIAEIGWDGGVSEENAAQLALGGIEVLVSGGAIQKAPDPAAAYKKLSELAEKSTA